MRRYAVSNEVSRLLVKIRNGIVPASIPAKASHICGFYSHLLCSHSNKAILRLTLIFLSHTAIFHSFSNFPRVLLFSCPCSDSDSLQHWYLVYYPDGYRQVYFIQHYDIYNMIGSDIPIGYKYRDRLKSRPSYPSTTQYLSKSSFVKFFCISIFTQALPIAVSIAPNPSYAASPAMLLGYQAALSNRPEHFPQNCILFGFLIPIFFFSDRSFTTDNNFLLYFPLRY